jgi:hypothetical protein
MTASTIFLCCAKQQDACLRIQRDGERIRTLQRFWDGKDQQQTMQEKKKRIY